MRIYLFSTKLNFKSAGGAVYDLDNKARGLTELGHEVTVVTVFSRNNALSKALPYKIVEENIPYSGLLGIQKDGYIILKKYENKADIYYLDGTVFPYSGGLYKLLGGKLPIVSFYNMRLNCWRDPTANTAKASFLKKIKQKLRFFIEHRFGVPIANKIDAFIFNTPHLGEVYYDFGYKKNKGNVIEDVIATQDLINKYSITPEWIAKHQSDDNKIIIYTAGRIYKEKGFDILIKAFKLIENKDKFKIIIGGTGPDENILFDLVKELGLEKYVEFIGWVAKEAVYENYKKAHIFVYPKWYIEYGAAIINEAMAFGLPCIIPAGGALEWLAEGGAMPYEQENYQNMADKIKQLENKDLRLKLALGSLAKAKKLDYKNLVVKLEKVMRLAVDK